jgi:2-methylisocitrate lyase-like PEP mutase family enzyme
MPERNLRSDARRLRALHVPGQPLLLANIWDPPTARIVAATGYQAIATASAALAPVSGYEDHGRMPADLVFGALRRICSAVELPVTADLEDGYGLSARELVERSAAAGVCGINLEDTSHSTHALKEPDEHATFIADVRAAARECDIDLVINARIDVQLHRRSQKEGLDRARRYLAAGADCVYPILLSDCDAIREYTALGAVNVLWRPRGPTLAQLACAQVARISIGPCFYQLMLRQLRAAAEALRAGEENRVWQ